MYIKPIVSEVEVYNNIEELNNDDKLLVGNAVNASENAFAPYSNFFVGAAIMLENGTIVKGNNQENSAFPSGMCAERVALYSANANFKNLKIRSIAIYAKSNSFTLKQPVFPCGACRQVMIDYELAQKEPIKVIMCSEKSEIYITKDVKTLMPLHFDSI
ncbi:MAG: cytidine deaminase [Bacteroidota bacterium]